MKEEGWQTLPFHRQRGNVHHATKPLLNFSLRVGLFYELDIVY